MSLSSEVDTPKRRSTQLEEPPWLDLPKVTHDGLLCFEWLELLCARCSGLKGCQESETSNTKCTSKVAKLESKAGSCKKNALYKNCFVNYQTHQSLLDSDETDPHCEVHRADNGTRAHAGSSIDGGDAAH